MEQNKIWDYFQNVSDYDSFGGAIPRYEFIARNISSKDKVLNIGVGRGGLEKLLLEKNVDISSLDPSDASIEALRSLGMEGKAKVGYSQKIPFSSDSFDVVIMSEVLEHLDDQVLSETLDEVRRVLKQGGCFLGTVPANEILKGGETVCPDCGNQFHRWGHVQSFSKDRLKNILQLHNYSSIKLDYYSFPDRSRKSISGLIKTFIRYCLGRIGASIALPSIYFRALK